MNFCSQRPDEKTVITFLAYLFARVVEISTETHVLSVEKISHSRLFQLFRELGEKHTAARSFVGSQFAHLFSLLFGGRQWLAYTNLFGPL